MESSNLLLKLTTCGYRILFCDSGKSLYVQRTGEKLQMRCHRTTVRLLERAIDTDYVVERLLRPFANRRVTDAPLIVHVDLTPAVSVCSNSACRSELFENG